jgi:hypothetical protein
LLNTDIRKKQINPSDEKVTSLIFIAKDLLTPTIKLSSSTIITTVNIVANPIKPETKGLIRNFEAKLNSLDEIFTLSVENFVALSTIYLFSGNLFYFSIIMRKLSAKNFKQIVMLATLANAINVLYWLLSIIMKYLTLS